jgi:glyoxylase-like metal-dependent hydrolase (beta-lactamase superfamily II)
MFATNCWIIAPGAGQECLLIDPGMPDISRPGHAPNLAPHIEMVIEEHGLKPVAALLTHGHLDHTFSITPLADGYAIPAYIHPEDLRFVAEPAGIHGVEFREMISQFSFSAPQQLLPLKDGAILNFLDFSIRAIHSPGHTAGSLMFMVDEETLLSGDVLFAGSIGRTDLPTGDMKAMKSTLSKKVLTLDDSVRVLPGHGKETTIGNERKFNPYLKELSL